MRKFPRRRMRSILINFGSVNDNFLEPAEEDGDWDLLAEFFDQGGYHRVTKEMGEFLSKVLRGEIKRRRGRVKSHRTRDLYLQIGQFVKSAVDDGAKLAAAKRSAQKEFRKDLKTVERAIKYLREAEEAFARFNREENSDN
jgi:hypothetical protein